MKKIIAVLFFLILSAIGQVMASGEMPEELNVNVDGQRRVFSYAWLRDGQVYGDPLLLEEGGKWNVTFAGANVYVSVKPEGGEPADQVAIPYENRGINKSVDLSFFAQRAGISYIVDEKKGTIDIRKTELQTAGKAENGEETAGNKKHKNSKSRKPVKKENKTPAETGTSALQTGRLPVLILWDPNSSFDPEVPFVSPKTAERIISPSWFVSHEDGIHQVTLPVGYIAAVKKAGMEIMPLVNNGFDPNTTKKFLGDEKQVHQMAVRLSSYAAVYGLDGYNIDFENMDPADKFRFTDFIKNAADLLHKEGKKISVCVTGIESQQSFWSGCYDRKALSQEADQIVFMGYDQTWAASSTPGSVSSYGWLEKHIQRLLKEVAPEKLVLGLPFYTRVWTETDGRLSSSVLTMKNTAEFLSGHPRVVPVWLTNERQYYAHWEENGTMKYLWMEDNRSLNEKISLARIYHLGGTAYWRCGFEPDGIWNRLGDTLESLADRNNRETV